MNLNRPYCERTNQIDDFLVHIQSQERNSFDMLRKSTFCSHFYLFKNVRCSHFFQHPLTKNLYLFVFVLAFSQTNGNPIRNRADILPLNILWASHYMTSSFASFLTQSLLVSQLKLVTSHLLQCLILPCLVDYYISNSF